MHRFWIYVLWQLWCFLLPSALGWNRSALIYHLETRDGESWKRNFMRVDENGKFIGQWLFDHAILTAVTINEKDIMYGGLDGQDLLNLWDKLSSDARQVDKAIGELLVPFPKNDGRIQLSLAMPYIDGKDRTVYVEGKSYSLKNPLDRKNLVTWYILKVNQLRQSGELKNVDILGVYYHREDIIDAYGDVEIVTYFNQQVHKMGMKSVHVPYYNAPHAWDGKTLLGFDVLVVQPGYSFASSIDRGTATGDRLYAIGRKSANLNQCFEYELRGGGQDRLENWIAHQYLAVAQSSGAAKFPQVFFVGSDFFDRMGAGSRQNGDRWWAYSDLANYLGGLPIANMEIWISFGPNDYQQVSTNVRSKNWIVPAGYEGITSIRLDFSDSNGYWKGKLVVRLPGSAFSAFSQRTGADTIDPSYNSVLTPTANLNITAGMNLVIELHRETATTPWPTIIQMIAAKFEPPYLANPLFEDTSSSSVSVVEGPYADNAPTHKQYAQGKLTDGKVAVGESWDWDGIMGWTLIPEGVFSITIDLGQVVSSVADVRIWSHVDGSSAVRLPTKLGAFVATSCPPRVRGTLELGCPPTASSGPVEIIKIDGNNNNDDRYLLYLRFENVKGRWVTISGVPLAWFLLDEVEVRDNTGTVLSRGKPYIVTPIPGEGKSSFAYPDTGRKLVDGAIFKKFVGGSTGIVGISKEQKDGQVEVVWATAKLVTCMRVWMTEADSDYGIGLPGNVTLQVRDYQRNWQSGVKVATLQSCGPSPCARLCFDSKRFVTGVRASFFSLQAWVMVTEITVE